MQAELIYMSADDVEHDRSEFGSDSWYQRAGWYLMDSETGQPLAGPHESPKLCYQ